MSRISRISLALLLSAASISPAAATVYIFHGTFSGNQEVPPVTSSGFGSVSLVWDDVAHTLAIDLGFGGLTGNTTAAHIHAPVNPVTNTAGVATTLPSFVGFPTGVTSGSFNNTLDLTQASTFNTNFINNFGGGTVAGAEAALLAALLGGDAYFNIHTSFAPGGEIRANLSLVPESSTWMLMIGGFAAVGVVLRRRRRTEVPAAA